MSLFSEPAGGSYRRACRLAVGERIKLGEPFDIELDTDRFE